MHVLLVNDDGISSRGIHALAEEGVKRGHRVTVCAPNKQQSAVGQAITFFRPIGVEQVEIPGASAYAVDGTPADCARLGLVSLAQGEVDVVISGINDGLNAGTAIYCSGTVGAAREAALLGKKAMAVSLGRPADEGMIAHLASLAFNLGEKLARYPAPPLSVLNVNAPALPGEELLPMVMAPVNHGMFLNRYERRLSPRGDMYYWVMPEYTRDPAAPDSDEHLLQKGHITCTFLLHSPENTKMDLEFLQDA